WGSARETPSMAFPFARPRLRPLLPGLALTGAVTVASIGVAALETRALGHPVIEGLVVAILLGMIVRTAWRPPPRFDAGVKFAAKELLELAIFLLGVSVDLPLLLAAGPALAVGIVLLVTLGIAFSYGVGRMLGLPRKLAVLVACGNSICGNSAIAAVAPVIDADAEHVASSIAFTAVLGVVVVVGLPLLRAPLGLSFYQYGVLAGLTVYSVPQVLAAAFPVSTLSGQVGTLVKLVRVLMLGPVVLFFAVRNRRRPPGPGAVGEPRPVASFRLTRFVPWFIIGFLALAAVRSAGLAPPTIVEPARLVSGWLTVLAMAALGLGCDLRAILRAGQRVVLAVSASLILLAGLGVSLIQLLGIR
ncbi:MAG TPA: putative sulfate exporter family transporter, partial [Gemmatimonadaceae bacterium]|nr:putative sulfate exporter family transporter [Gemmatimonadaceae bacterium]